MSNREWAALYVLGGLLVVVVVVGLVRQDIDATAIALALITAISAWITGLIAKGKFGNSDKDEKP